MANLLLVNSLISQSFSPGSAKIRFWKFFILQSNRQVRLRLGMRSKYFKLKFWILRGWTFEPDIISLMQLIQTEHFQLAINTKGNPSSAKLAICLPGRLDTKDYANFSSHLEYLATKRYFAVAFDPPGTWDSPGEIEYTTTNYIKAVNELIKYFGNESTLLLGHSRGGQVAMLVGTSNPNVAGFVVVNASYEPPSPPDPERIKDGVIIEHRDFPPGDTKTVEQKQFLLSANYFKDGEQYDPVPALQKCTKPKLLFYSTDDKFTEPEEVKAIYESLPEPKMIHELKTVHDYRYSVEAIEEVNQVMGLFLDKYFS